MGAGRPRGGEKNKTKNTRVYATGPKKAPIHLHLLCLSKRVVIANCWFVGRMAYLYGRWRRAFLGMMNPEPKNSETDFGGLFVIVMIQKVIS